MSNGQDAARKAEVDAILAGGNVAINRFLITSVMSIQENGCSKGRQQDDRLTALEKGKPSDRKIIGFLTIGHIKAAGVPAILLAAFIGMGIFQYYHAKAEAVKVKQEVVEVAKEKAAEIVTDKMLEKATVLFRQFVREELEKRH